MKIKVTKEHIDKGRKKSALSCPIALAIGDKYGLDASVGPESCVIGYTICDLPKSVKKFIKLFDNGYSVEPFEFNINLKIKDE